MRERTIIPAVSVALRRGDRLLLVRRAKAPSQGKYAFPGGRVEARETLEEAARRELKEETGLDVADLKPIAHFVFEGDVVSFDLTVFSGRDVGGEPVAADDAETAGFYSFAEMETMPVTDSVMTVTRGLLCRPADA